MATKAKKATEPARYQRTITAEVASLKRVHDELVAFFDEHGIPAQASHDAQVVCDELITNAIKHGLPRGLGPGEAGRDHHIDVGVTLPLLHLRGEGGGDDSTIAIRIRDDLPLFDPTAAPVAKSAATSIAVAPIGGRGLAMVRRATNSFRWHADEGQCNVVEAKVAIRR